MRRNIIVGNLSPEMLKAIKATKMTTRRRLQYNIKEIRSRIMERFEKTLAYLAK